MENFEIDSKSDLEDQANELRALGINVMDQFALEENVAAQVDEAVMKQNRKQKIQILTKEIKESKLELVKLKNKEHDLEERLNGMRQRVTDPRQVFTVEKDLKECKQQQQDLLKRKSYIEDKLDAASNDQSVLDTVDLNLEEGELIDDDNDQDDKKLYEEHHRETMIKEGKMTPFGTILKAAVPSEEKIKKLQNCFSSSETKDPLPNFIDKSSSKREKDPSSNLEYSQKKEGIALKSKNMKILSEFEKYLQDQIDKQRYHNKGAESSGDRKNNKVSKKRKQNLVEFDPFTDDTKKDMLNKEKKFLPLKKRILQPKKHWKEKNIGSITSELETDQLKNTPKRLLSENVAFVTSEDEEMESGSEYIPSEENVSEEEMENMDSQECKREKTETKLSSTKAKKKVIRSKKVADDGYLDNYIKRIQKWKRERLEEKHRKILAGEDLDSDEEEEYERFEGNYKIPMSIWNKLFKYQKTCVKWLWELHYQQCGGILGDEMGLGKTVMIISFLIGLSYSGLFDRNIHKKGLGSVLIVCPATVLHQWVKEFHKWWPPFRVAVLHESGVFRGKKNALIHDINKHDGILVTSYRGVVDNLKVLLNYDWHYIILDEGHKIRNPEAQITVAVKRFQTPHKLILSGSPIQNGLKELWSLFDFIFPGKLGTLPVFLQQFAVPITQGGYANASKLEVQTAFKCATVLRDTINPYLLRRMKIDVKNHLFLPNKNEQVLFCGLSEEQRSIYRHYIDGNEVRNILSGRLQVFVGLINLRKICNHPDLYDGGPKHLVNEDISGLQPELKYGWFKRSGKMVVLHSILRLWKKQNHKVLLFTQSRQMLCILENYLINENYQYLKMDGGTSVGSRQSIIDKFNNDPSIFVFLLTTRVGGLGVNLTGADRVVIFDPDWNPSTDAQARERAWRIGQTRHVTIYRLLTAGTIEEKIYHRQIFKQFLTNRVLKDPKQQRFFKSNDLYELFTLNEGEKEKTESAAIFAGTGSEIVVKGKEKKGSKNCSADKKQSESKIIKLDAYHSDDAVSAALDKSEGKNRDSFKSNAAINLEQNKDEEVVPSYQNFKCAELNLQENGSDKDTLNDLHPNTEFKDIMNNNNELIETDEKEKNELHSEMELQKKEKMRAMAKRLSEKIGKNKVESMNFKEDALEKEKKKKCKKSKEREKKGKKCEGERIKNLVKKRKFKYANESEEGEKEKLNKAQDDFVLQKLFKRSGVHTAISHDVIIDSSDPDYLLLESEAEKVAKDALRQIRLSRARCLQAQQRSNNNNSISSKDRAVRRFGSKRSTLISSDKKEPKINSAKNSSPKMFSGGEYEEKEKVPAKESGNTTVSYPTPVEEGTSSGVLSSAQLLKRMRERNRSSNISTFLPSFSNPDEDNPNETDPTSDTYDPDYPSTAIFDDNTEMDPELEQHVDLLSDIRNFVAFQAATDGCASTDEVVQRFKDRVPPNQNHIFKALLNKICDFSRDTSGIGLWYLKEEFR